MGVCRLILAGKGIEVRGAEELRELLAPLLEGRPAEVWLENPPHGNLCLLSNGRDALLTHLPDTEGEHPGWTTRAAEGEDRNKAVSGFVLSNGQVDEFPVSWVVPLEEGITAFLHFSTHGTRAPWLTWHDDSLT